MGNVVVVPPNKAAVISGCGGTKYLIGECGWAWCCCNSVNYLDLELMQLNVSSRQVETGEGVKLNVDAVTQVKVGCFPPAAEGMQRTLDKNNLQLACQHFLGEKTKAVQQSLTATMEGHQRQVLGTLTVEKIYKDREAFANTVKEGVLDDMKNMGYEIVSYVVTDVSDDNGYMDALGETQTAKVKRDAAEGVAMHEAEQRKVVAQCKAEADVAEAKKRQSSRMTVNAHQTEAEVDINKKRQAEEDSKTALKLKMADNERTVKLREAEIQTEVGKKEEMARAAALIQKAMEEQKVMKERTQQQVEEAKVLLQVAEQQALTAQKEAEGTSLAELVEKQNASKAMLVEAQAEADAQLAKAKARAEEIAAVGAAEASAIQAKGQAEALVLKEKNQTYQYMGEAGITDIVMNKMPEIAGAIAAPLSKTEKMVFISQDDATGSKVTKDIIKTIATLPDAVEGLTGLDLKNAIAKATRL
jgi:flotillin